MPDWCRPWGNGYVTTRSLTHLAPPQVVVPEGFQFNVSVPRWAHWFIHPHDERFLKAACFHDYAILELQWSRFRAAVLWSKILDPRTDVPRWKKWLLFVVLAVWPGK